MSTSYCTCTTRLLINTFKLSTRRSASGNSEDAPNSRQRRKKGREGEVNRKGGRLQLGSARGLVAPDGGLCVGLTGSDRPSTSAAAEARRPLLGERSGRTVRSLPHDAAHDHRKAAPTRPPVGQQVSKSRNAVHEPRQLGIIWAIDAGALRVLPAGRVRASPSPQCPPHPAVPVVSQLPLGARHEPADADSDASAYTASGAAALSGPAQPRGR